MCATRTSPEAQTGSGSRNTLAVGVSEHVCSSVAMTVWRYVFYTTLRAYRFDRHHLSKNVWDGPSMR